MRHIANGIFLLLAATGAALADANGDFENLYGEKARKVAATAGTADDAAFAGTCAPEGFEVRKAAATRADVNRMVISGS